MTDNYQQEYDKAAAELEAAASGNAATTAPAEVAEPAIAAPAVEAPATQPEAEPKQETAEELRARLEKAEKALADTKAWGTRTAQELADFKRKQELAQREASKPQILEEQPELADAIRYVTADPTPQIEQENRQAAWMSTVERAHPGIFTDTPPELEAAILARKGEADWSDPLVAIAEITAAKLAHAEAQLSKRFQAEAEKLQQKTAMGVPSASASAVATQPVDKALAEVQRIQNMTPAEFEKEVRRVKGY